MQRGNASAPRPRVFSTFFRPVVRGNRGVLLRQESVDFDHPAKRNQDVFLGRLVNRIVLVTFEISFIVESHHEANIERVCRCR